VTAATIPPAAAASLPALLIALTLALLTACTTTPARLEPERPAAELTGVPFYPDTEYYCGPAALATVLTWAGVHTTPDELVGSLFIPERQGTLQPELMARARRAGRLAYPLDGGLRRLATEVRAGHPVLVLQNLALNWWPRWHYAVVVGVRPERDLLILRSGPRARHRVATHVFHATWARAGGWALVVTPPGVLPATARADGAFAAIADLEATAGPDASLPYWRAATRRWPASHRLALGLANSLAALQRPERAAAALRPVADQAGPLQAVVLNNLAMLEAGLGHLEKAESLARRAVALGGTHAAAFRDTLRDIRCRRHGC
jgi:hypothetical protein